MAAFLDWQEFSAAYFPGSHRHDFEALIAYGSYRRSRGVDKPLPDGARVPENRSALDAWEDDGGPAM